MAGLAVMTTGYQLNEVYGSIRGRGVAPGEIRISFIFGVKKPTDQQGEIMIGINRDDLSSFEYQPAEGEKSTRAFSEIKSDRDLVEALKPLVKGRKIETFNYRPLEGRGRISLWLKDGSKIRFNTTRGPMGVPRGRVMLGGKGIKVLELPFSEDSGYFLSSNEEAPAG
jgi:hypothetical protein